MYEQLFHFNDFQVDVFNLPKKEFQVVILSYTTFLIIPVTKVGHYNTHIPLNTALLRFGLIRIMVPIRIFKNNTHQIVNLVLNIGVLSLFCIDIKET